ncbi:LysR family transcriptional regulator [Streptomyces asoensis]|uniref:LysR family transcriptional regulator n=1 Tax=Streptomyces asoensis TaxID=249586 RepID=A0ABQ3RRT9_9ACTN|nr:LysR family transcriptional regulator [Streptomyces asoensis]GGQ44918.1 LysR family transcriptional regulator [Streptomyces asoensis]GHI58570.1 LysR family transcriptional regulator [Streptomyces asoensis]
MIDVRRMQVLRAVVGNGSVTGAAAALGYTPSAISQQIAALEKEAGAPLLERVGRGVRPTAAGLLLTGYADAIGRQLAEAETALADLLAGRTGQLAVRYFATAGAGLVAPAVARLREAHPGVRVDLRLTADPQDPSAEVREGRADLALLVGSAELRGDGVRLTRLLDDPYLAVLPRGHRLAGRRSVRLAELAEEPFVGSEWPGPCLDAQLDACAAAGFRPGFAVQSEDYMTAQGFVAAGLGVSLVPRLGLGSRHPGVVVREVRDPVPVRVIQAVTRATAPAQPALDAFVDALKQAARAS